jgi:hypothetical protein
MEPTTPEKGEREHGSSEHRDRTDRHADLERDDVRRQDACKTNGERRRVRRAGSGCCPALREISPQRRPVSHVQRADRRDDRCDGGRKQMAEVVAEDERMSLQDDEVGWVSDRKERRGLVREQCARERVRQDWGTERTDHPDDERCQQKDGRVVGEGGGDQNGEAADEEEEHVLTSASEPVRAAGHPREHTALLRDGGRRHQAEKKEQHIPLRSDRGKGFNGGQRSDRQHGERPDDGDDPLANSTRPRKDAAEREDE